MPILRLLVLYLFPTLLLANPVQEAVMKLERLQMQWLAIEQNKPGINIQAFASDGCSGGMSDAWQYMSQMLPAFSTQFGNKPPWEHCCVEHDRAYWYGDTEKGYAKRLKADQRLRACVKQNGRENSKRLSNKFEMTQEEIETLFNIAAEMMFDSVRIGGKPCSLFSWRWGYGWPYCAIDTNHNE